MIPTIRYFDIVGGIESKNWNRLETRDGEET